MSKHHDHESVPSSLNQDGREEGCHSDTQNSRSEDVPLKILNELLDNAKTNASVSPSKEHMFSGVSKCCFIKALEFSRLVHSELGKGTAFFLAPSLRGICEDLIALAYLTENKNKAERDEIIMNGLCLESVHSSKKQKTFFERRRPFQPVFHMSEPQSSRWKDLPKVREMAKASQLEEVYDFMYALTSEMVHFSPRIIARGAWGSDENSMKYSPDHFDGYYVDFCRVYSAFLICEHVRLLSSNLDISSGLLEKVNCLRAYIDEILRWPEAVTFEEMNIEGPSFLSRIVLRGMSRGKNAAM